MRSYFHKPVQLVGLSILLKAQTSTVLLSRKRRSERTPASLRPFELDLFYMGSQKLTMQFLPTSATSTLPWNNRGHSENLGQTYRLTFTHNRKILGSSPGRSTILFKALGELSFSEPLSLRSMAATPQAPHNSWLFRGHLKLQSLDNPKPVYQLSQRYFP